MRRAELHEGLDRHTARRPMGLLAPAPAHQSGGLLPGRALEGDGPARPLGRAAGGASGPDQASALPIERTEHAQRLEAGVEGRQGGLQGLCGPGGITGWFLASCLVLIVRLRRDWRWLGGAAMHRRQRGPALPHVGTVQPGPASCTSKRLRAAAAAPRAAGNAISERWAAARCDQGAREEGWRHGRRAAAAALLAAA